MTIQIKGLVQGVGFRPFIYRLAHEYSLKGWVVNGTDGVTIKAEGLGSSLEAFLDDIKLKAPVVSQIEGIIINKALPEGLNDFSIIASRDLTDETSEISPDIAVCADCLADMRMQPHRIQYPFINCTNCGPRFSIINDFPYDRVNTTMSSFQMCHVCKSEYEEITNRRFHAQPVACNNCGPVYTMHVAEKIVTRLDDILTHSSEMIDDGKIIAVKGVGGFHILCDALNEASVNNLRNVKKREGKPFAVMFRDIESVKSFAFVSETEENSLNSWGRPIVILHCKEQPAYNISMGLNTIGAILPYMPFHYLLFEKLKTLCIVFTSGNFSNEPVLIDNDIAVKSFSGFASAVITYNRDISNRTDDSVVAVFNNKEKVIRRSRGFVPLPIKVGFNCNGILASGAELANCFCLGKGSRAYLSQHIGDIKNNATYSFFEETLERFQKLFRVKADTIATDLHPDYLTNRFARKSGLKLISVQHHHAHIASCMAENSINEPVIGLAFDGTGYGEDGHIWGSEFMVCDFRHYERQMHFSYMPMPGGDRASEEPWRMGLALLYSAYGNDFNNLNLPFLKGIDKSLMSRIIESIKKDINCPLTSGAGRLFDAVAAITGICTHSYFDAEAPMRLESLIETGIKDYYDYEIGDTISFLPCIKDICREITENVPLSTISARFHNTITEAAVKAVNIISNKTGIRKVVLSGGTFQNRYLSETLELKLSESKFTVITHSKVPCNDGGIALGQLAIAANKR